MSSIVKMILRRLLTLVPLMLGIALFVFVIMRLSPVNSAVAALGDQASPEQIAEYEASRGLDQPAPVQFVRFLGNVIQGDFGETIGISKPVAGLIAEALPLTMQLTLLGVGLALVIALALGITAALFRDRWPDQVIRVLITFLLGIH